MSTPGTVPIEALPDATLVVSADGVLAAANAAAVALLGLPPDARGRPLADLVDLHNDAGRPVQLRDLAAGGPAERQRLRTGAGGMGLTVAVGHGDAGTVVVTAWPVPAGGPASGSELVAAAAHDLRNPLTSVKGFTTTLLRRWGRFDDDQKRAMLETVVADAERVAWLLTTLVEVSRIDEGSLRLREAPVDVAALARDAAEAVTAARGSAPDMVRVDAADPLPTVTGDAAKLLHALAHLVDNALASGPGEPVLVAIGAGGNGVQLRVVDDGRGVPPDQREAVFGRLARVPDQGSAGLGLGLYLVRGVIAAHGGTVWLDPDVTEGTTVHVQLPTSAA